ncbi:MAG: DHA2 family efflux MFS transporter permease subunit, partial [Micrococcales bacterium]
IDGTIVNTIFPKIIESLNLTSTDIQWVQESYVLVFASLLLVWGSLADRFGRRLMLVLGIAIFVAASIWAGASTDAQSMILARVIQGIGGAMVLPTTLSLVNTNFQGKERGIAFAIWGSTIGGMVAVGPVLGGWLATIDWRWAFYVNVPFGVIVILGLLWQVNESKAQQRPGRIDYLGALISVIMLGFLVFSLIEGRIYGWWAPTENTSIFGLNWSLAEVSIIPFTLAISILAFVWFVMHERARDRAHKNVLLDMGLFAIPSFRNGSIAVLIISMGEFGLIFALPLWLQNVEGLNSLSSGLVLLWLAGGAFIASGVVGSLSGKLSARSSVQIGVLLEVVGVAGIAYFAQAGQGWGPLSPFLFIYGFGVGMATAQLTGVILVDVPQNKIGQASGSQSTLRQVGSALGIAVLGTTLFTASQAAIETRIVTDLSQFGNSKQLPVLAKSVADAVVSSSGGAIPGIQARAEAQKVPTQVAQVLEGEAMLGFTDGVKTTGWVAAGFLLLGFLATFNLGSGRKTKRK